MKPVLLGTFKLTSSKVTLEATRDETRFTVKYWDRNQKRGIVAPVPTETVEYPSLDAALDLFETLARRIVLLTTVDETTDFLRTGT